MKKQFEMFLQRLNTIFVITKTNTDHFLNAVRIWKMCVFGNRFNLITRLSYMIIGLIVLSVNVAEAQNITVGSGETLTISVNTTYSSLTVNNGGKLVIQAPATLTVGTIGNSATNQVVDFQNGSIVEINAGSFMVVYGLMNNSNNSDNVTINGDVYVDGNYQGGQKSAIGGNGTFNSSGKMTTDGNNASNNGLIFNSPTDCNSGPCSGNNLTCSMANTISTANQSICQGNSAAPLVGSTIASATYQWQSSSNGSLFTNISGATSKDYSPGSITSTTYYLRNATTSCTNRSAQRVVVVSSGVPSGTAVISGSSPVCQNTSNTYTVSGITGATGYTWSVPTGATITAGAGTASITVTMGTASGSVSVVPYNVCGNATGASLGSKAVSVNLTNAATITYPAANYCKDNTTSQTPVLSGTSGGTFSFTGGATLGSFSTSTGSFVPNTSTANKTYTITYAMAATACPAATATTTFTISGSSSFNSGAMSGSGTTTAPLCQNSTGLVFTVNSGATSYAWTVPSGSIITSGATGNSITVTLGGTSGSVTVTPFSGCTSTTLTKAITINAFPTITSTTPATRCNGGSVVISAVSSAGTIDWFAGASSGTSLFTGSSYNFTATGTVTLYAQASNNGCINTSRTAVVVTINNCPITWTGAASTVWTTTGNWSSGTVPTSVDTVTIPASVPNYPAVSTSVNLNKLTINSGASISVTSTGNINVYGNIINNGTFTAVPGSAVSFVGSSAQTITGVPVLYNVVINNTSGGVALSSAVTVNGSLSLTKGILTTNSNLTINFDNGGNIAYNVSDAGSISGTVSGRRDASVRTHYLAAPFSGVTSAQVQATTPLFVNPYWKMSSKNFDTQGWTAVINTSTAMPLGMGFSLSLPAAAPLIFTGTYDHTFALTGDSYSNAAAGKFFMVGNPYPSTLDWNNASGWTKTNVANAIYFWDPVNNRTATYVGGTGTNGGTQYIAPMQSVLVATTGLAGSSSVSINNNARLIQNTSYFRAAQDDVVRLTLMSAADSTYNDETVIRFNETATADFDYDLDAFKLFSAEEMLSVYTASDKDVYSINSFASVESVQYIPVGTKLASDGTYKLKITGTDPNVDYILKDKLLHIEQSIERGSSYVFTGEKTDNENRFELQLRTSTATVPTGVQLAGTNTGLGIYSSTKGFVIKTDRYAGEEAEIEILDMTGRSINILSAKSLTMGSTYIPLDMADGAYLIKVHVHAEAFAGMISLVK